MFTHEKIEYKKGEYILGDDIQKAKQNIQKPEAAIILEGTPNSCVHYH